MEQSGQSLQEVTQEAGESKHPEYAQAIMVLAGEGKSQAQVCLLGALSGHTCHLRLKSLSLPVLTPMVSVYLPYLLQAHRLPVNTAHSQPMCKFLTPKLTWRLTVPNSIPHIKTGMHPRSPIEVP